MRITAAVAALTLIATLGSSCGGGSLSRGSALEKLKQRQEKRIADGDAVKTASFKIPHTFTNRYVGRTETGAASYMSSENLPYKRLADRGLIQVVRGLRCSAIGHTYNACDVIVFTEEGRRASAQWKSRKEQEPYGGFRFDAPHSELGTAYQWEVPVATAEIMSVTGIVQKPDSTRAEVEYEFRWRPTEFAWLDRKGIDEMPQTRTATFTKYDDGWRLSGN